MTALAAEIIDELTDPATPAFALLYRPHGSRDVVDVLVGNVSTIATLSDLPLPVEGDTCGVATHDLLAVVPYRQIAERGFACRDDGTPLVSLAVTRQRRLDLADALVSLPATVVGLVNANFDIDDAAYATLVRKILADEIGQGSGSNFVIKRSFVATIENFSRHTALAIFRRLLEFELGAYWTFVVHTGSRTLVGATPERHVSLLDGVATMNPISGTYRYPESGPDLQGVLRFLGDRKETDELYMVLDEELKMMARVCDRGGRAAGPFLKQMARVAHTEYLISGDSTLDARELLRQTMFAPTVTGSPLENACRVITRYEPAGRGYYGGVLALLGRNAAGRRTLDSAIMIRAADIDNNGGLSIGVGATLVRHSDPDSEVAETRGKVAGVLASLRAHRATAPASTVDDHDESVVPLGKHVDVRRKLALRNRHLARYWLDQGGALDHVVASLRGRRVLVVDAEDTFTAMLAHQLRSLGLEVAIRNVGEAIETTGRDLIVVGPGPGDPTDEHDEKVVTMRGLIRDLLANRMPFLAVCLSHQILAGVLGLPVSRRDTPNQGTQREIELFGSVERVGFYNSFVARSDTAEIHRVGVGAVGLSRDRTTGEIHAMRGQRFGSFQFHPESVLTEHGVAILAEEITSLLPGKHALAG